MTAIIETNYGNFQIGPFNDNENGMGYDVYTEPHKDEIFGRYIGEFYPTIKWDNDMDEYEKEIFISELEDFIDEKY